LSSQPLRPGDPVRLGGYRLHSRLGAGGMGTVFLGRSPQGRLVAVKVVRTEFIRDEEFLGRFRSEVSRARQVPPFCTAEVLDADLDHDPPYLVVEYVDGPTLTDVIRERGPLSPAALQSAAVGIATALSAIHGAGVIHRDLKPGNVLFALGGLKVIDFGIARPLEATSQHTRTDQMVGTVAYMAPERFDEHPGLRVSPAADIFAWGAVVAFAATGRTPFQADSAPATAMRILTQEPDLSGLPAPLRGIVARTLAKNPTERPTARELLDLLLDAERQPGAGLPPQPAPNHPDRPANGRIAPGRPAPGVHPAPGRSASGRVVPMRPAAGARPAPARSASGRVAPMRPAAGARPTPGRSASGRIVPVRPGRPVMPAGRRRLMRVGLAAVAAVAVLATAGLVARSGLGEALRDSPATGIPGARTPSARADATASPGADGIPGVLAGTRRTLIHFSEADKNLTLPEPVATAGATDGTGEAAQFALDPIGVDWMIKSARSEGEEDPPCLGVKVIPGSSSPLVSVDCVPTEATIFTVLLTGDVDDQNRPTYTIYNDEYGNVQYNESEDEVYVESVGDAPADTFILFDRGPL